LGTFGNYYFVELALASDIFLHWFISAGGWVNLGLSSGTMLFSFGPRILIGIL